MHDDFWDFPCCIIIFLILGGCVIGWSIYESDEFSEYQAKTIVAQGRIEKLEIDYNAEVNSRAYFVTINGKQAEICKSCYDLVQVNMTVIVYADKHCVIQKEDV